MNDDGGKEDAIIARCDVCKRVVFATVNIPRVMDTEMFKDIGKLIKDGCSVEHMTIANVRKSAFGCRCHEQNAPTYNHPQTELERCAKCGDACHLLDVEGTKKWLCCNLDCSHVEVKAPEENQRN